MGVDDDGFYTAQLGGHIGIIIQVMAIHKCFIKVEELAYLEHSYALLGLEFHIKVTHHVVGEVVSGHLK